MDNLLKLIGNQVTPEVIKAASGMVGVSEKQAEAAMGAGIPAIIGALMQQGSSVQGAQQIMQTLDQQPQGMDMLGNFAGLLGGGDSSNMLMNLGGSLLSGMMGKNESGVIGLISSLAGTDSKSSSSLMKLLMPLGMAVLGKVVKGQKLDAAGLIKLLMGQKDHMRAAAPAGLTSALGLGSFDDLRMPDLSSLTPNMPNIKIPDVKVPDVNLPKAPSIKVPDVKVPDVNLPKVPKVDIKAPKVDVKAPSGGGLGRWLWPLLALLALAALLWWFLGRGTPAVPAVEVPAVPAVEVPAVPAVEVPAVELPEAVCGGITALQGSLDGFPAIAADTQVSVVKEGMAGLRGNLDKVVSAVSAVSGLNIPGLDMIQSGLTSLEGLVNAVTGDTVGDAAAGINTAFTQVKDAGATVIGGVNCKK